MRICKRDHGGGGPFFSDNFVTFLKARIYCSYTRAGQSPYDFNEIGNTRSFEHGIVNLHVF